MAVLWLEAYHYDEGASISEHLSILITWLESKAELNILRNPPLRLDHHLLPL